MKKLLFCLFCFVLPATLLCAQPATTKYIKKYRPLANALAAEYHIPASVILGVAIVESSSGTSQTARLLNNHFGMTGKNSLRKTHKIKTRYKQYGSAKASYRDFCQMLLRRKFFSKLKGVKGYKPWLTAIAKTGYSSRPTAWVQKISGVIVKHKL